MTSQPSRLARIKTRLKRPVRKVTLAVAGLGLAAGVGLIGGARAKNEYATRSGNRVITRAAHREMQSIRNLPWTVLVQAQKLTPTRTGKEFDRAVDELFSQRRQLDKSDEASRQQGQFIERGMDRFIESLAKLPEPEVAARLKILYPDEQSDHQLWRTAQARKVKEAREQLAKYFTERAARTREEFSRNPPSSIQKELSSINRAAKLYAQKIAALSGASALLAYAILLGGIYARRKIRE